MPAAKEEMPGRPLGGVGFPFKGFSRIRVLDFSKLLPGPYATQVLADMGCRVTRVELPHFGDISRGFSPKIDGVGSIYWMVNQGKKELVIDFRKPQGMKRLAGLIKSSDVLLEGFRTGLMDRIGLGFKAVRRLNSRIVYCSMSGYPPNGPWGRKAGHDLNFQAVSGFLGQGDSDGRVVAPSGQVADLAGSMAAVSGILAGLVERKITGRGRHVQVNLFDTIHSWLCIPLSYMRATGEDPSLGSHWWNGKSPFYRLYEAKDGRKLAVAAVEQGFAVSLLDELALSRLRDLTDDPLANAALLTGELERVFKTATTAEWEQRFKDKDFCVTPVNSLKEAAAFLKGLRGGSPGEARSRSRPGRPRESGRTRG